MNYVIKQLVDMDYYVNDKLYQFEVEKKGCLLNVVVNFPNQLKYKISFYDIDRFKEDLNEEIDDNCFFYEENVIFLKNVILENILKTISIFNDRKIYLKLIPCSS